MNKDNSKISRCNRALVFWKRLGWFPYCPKLIREEFKFINAKFYTPYNWIKYRARRKFQFFYD